MDLRQARAIANFLHDVGEWADKLSTHEAHLRECGLGELAYLSKLMQKNFVSILKKFAEMAKGDG